MKNRRISGIRPVGRRMLSSSSRKRSSRSIGRRLPRRLVSIFLWIFASVECYSVEEDNYLNNELRKLVELSDSCTLCMDGSVPTINNLREIISEIGDRTCYDLIQQASSTSNSSNLCHLIQLQGIRFCGCPGENIRQCSICAGGEEPMFPDNEVSWRGSRQSCRDLNESLEEHNDLCPTMRAKGHFECGCGSLPVIPTGACYLCNDPNDQYMDNLFGSNNDGDYYCSDAAVDIYSVGHGTDRCIHHQAEANLYCGCNSAPPPPLEPSCTLCPGNLLPSSPDKLLKDHSDITCLQYHRLVPTLFQSETCDEVISETRDYCGCPTEPICELCSSNEILFDPGKNVTLSSTNFTCAEVQDEASKIEFDNSIYEFQTSCQFLRSFSSECCIDESTGARNTRLNSSSPSGGKILGLQYEENYSGTPLLFCLLGNVICGITLLLLLL